MPEAAGFWVVHGGHLALAAAPAGVMAVGLRRSTSHATAHRARVDALRGSLDAPAGAWRGIAPAGPATTPAPAVSIEVAAVATVAAAAVHLTVMPAHVRESWLYGVFFLVAATAQVAWSVAVLRSADRRLLRAGVAGSLGVVALWAVTRTTGLAPLGREGVGTLDVVATACELVAAAAASASLRRAPVAGPGLPVRWPPLHRAVAGTALVCVVVVAALAPVS